VKILIVEGHEVLLDDEDWLRLCYKKWRIRVPKDGIKYFCYNGTVIINGERKRRTIYLHRAVMCPPYGLDLSKNEEVHHKDDPLDNRKEMLEIVTRYTHNKITHRK
jgi:hypothetical protein